MINDYSLRYYKNKSIVPIPTKVRPKQLKMFFENKIILQEGDARLKNPLELQELIVDTDIYSEEETEEQAAAEEESMRQNIENMFVPNTSRPVALPSSSTPDQAEDSLSSSTESMLNVVITPKRKA